MEEVTLVTGESDPDLKDLPYGDGARSALSGCLRRHSRGVDSRAWLAALWWRGSCNAGQPPNSMPSPRRLGSTVLLLLPPSIVRLKCAA
jgi:hypothetical protein